MAKKTKYDDITKKLFEKALEYKNKGNFKKAVEKFKHINKLIGDSAPATGMIASILYQELDRVEEALPYARKTVELSPKSELGSLCLVLCLFTLNMKEEMEQEIRRYVKIGNKFDNYNILFEENNLTKEDFL